MQCVKLSKLGREKKIVITKKAEGEKPSGKSRKYITCIRARECVIQLYAYNADFNCNGC